MVISEASLLTKNKTIKRFLTNLRQVDSWWYREFCSVILRNNRSSHGQYLWWGPLQRYIIVYCLHLISVYDGFNINWIPHIYWIPSILNASRIILESAVGGHGALVAKILRHWGTGFFLDRTGSGSLTTWSRMIYLFERKNKTLFHFLRINNIYLQKYDILRFTDLTLFYIVQSNLVIRYG